MALSFSRFLQREDEASEAAAVQAEAEEERVRVLKRQLFENEAYLTIERDMKAFFDEAEIPVAEHHEMLAATGAREAFRVVANYFKQLRLEAGVSE